MLLGPACKMADRPLLQKELRDPAADSPNALAKPCGQLSKHHGILFLGTLSQFG